MDIKVFRNRYIKFILPVLAALLITAAAALSGDKEVFGYLSIDPEIKNVLDDYFDKRCSAILSGNTGIVKEQFNMSSTYGKWSYEHEVKRINYTRDWSLARGLSFRECETKLKIFSIKGGETAVKVCLSDRTMMSYTYDNEENNDLNEFCIGTTHYLSMVKKNNTWYITADWYTDPLGDSMEGSGSASVDASVYKNVNSSWIKYNRTKAVEYADKYCGANISIEDGYKYNRKYRNFAGQGGDCANFASQVLSDSSGGGMRTGGGWLYKNGEASASWVNAGAFTRGLLYSGRAKLVSRGKYEKVVNFTKYISPGDIIAYEKKGDIVHVSIVTAVDSMGIPLVDSHTCDRYHVPWDLGWNGSDINFWLVRING